MNEFILTEASTPSSNTYQKKYKCPYCDQKFERRKLHIHIQNKHEEMIPEGYTALRIAFNTINNKTEGHCIICGNVTAWNEDKGRYERLCDDPKCKETYKKMAAERNKNKYGTERLQNDPRYAEEVQRKALAGRRIAGKYKFKDGGELEYLGAYEKQFLQFMDTIMNCNSSDIVAPGPTIEYEWEGKKHLYISDFYYTPYNLIVEIKDGGNNPNKNPAMQTYKTDRQMAKEKAVKATHKFNYIRLTNNNFGQLMGIMAVLKYNMMNDCYDIVMRINEASMMEDMSGTIAAALPLTPAPQPYESDPDNYYCVVHKDKDQYKYDITKDPLQYTVYGVSNEAPGKYKAYKSDKGKFDKSYLTFKIKDKQKAKDLYDELAALAKSGKSFYESDEYNNGSLDSNYIYAKLTEGSKILSEDQILFDNRFEFVKDFKSQLNEDCENLYNYLLHPSDLDLLKEQVEEVEAIING